MEALTKLKVMTASKNLTEQEITMQISYYSEEMQAYPLDAIQAAVAICIGEKWFPAWADLKTELVFYAQKRLAMLAGIKKALAKNHG